MSTIQILRDGILPANATTIRLPPRAGRSLFKGYLEYVESAKKNGGLTKCFDEFYGWNQRCVTGYYESEDSGVSTNVVYTLVQSWSAELLEHTKQDDWPKSFALSGGQQPDKAQPHGAVVLTHQPAQNNGSLNVSVAVFLPLESDDLQASKQHHSEYEFLLTLHGCFFVDSGRNAPYIGKGVRDTWNRRLLSDGVLPFLVPAIEALAKSGSCDSESIFRLTREIEKWLDKPEPVTSLVDGTARERVCHRNSWTCRWSSAGMQWESFDSTKPLLEIPDHSGDSSLPTRTMPALAEIAREFVLTPSGYPRVTLKEAEPWTDETLSRALVIVDPSQLFEDNGLGLQYLSKFLEKRSELQPRAVKALIKTVRGIFALTSSRVLDEHRETLERLS